MADPSPTPFRTASLRCPRCRLTELRPGTLRTCTTCKGSWIPEETLAEHVASMQKAPPHLPWSIATRAALPCVVCATPMDTLMLFEVAVDRCRAHGVWFDEHELAEVLLRSAEVRQEPVLENGSAITAIDVAELGVEVADVAIGAALHSSVEATIETAVEVGSSGIIEGILDVLGGIFSSIDL
ncbi:MAG: hypothetical protein H0X17_08715 [Deltaproteobacteria bacterium]|nr:hypothetical protein [Deltaproteobacteria bacterium]